MKKKILDVRTGYVNDIESHNKDEKQTAKKKPDYQYKAELMKNGTYDKYLPLAKTISKYEYSKNTGAIYYSQPTEEQYYDALREEEKFTGKEIKECARIKHASTVRAGRLKKRIETMLLKPNAVFFTFTFTDDELKKLSIKRRREYISKTLNEWCEDYAGNIDYGEKNEREHYHAIGNLKPEYMPKWTEGKKTYMKEAGKDPETGKILYVKSHEKYANPKGIYTKGHIQIKPIDIDTHSAVKLAKYVSKLTNHAIKETAGQQRYIYKKK